MSVLNRKVLVLNRLWQAIGEKSVQQSLIDLSNESESYTALDIDGERMVPTKWADWLKLLPLNDEEVIHTQHLRVRMPTVIIACGYDKVPKRRPKFTLANIAKRDGYRCQYTGELLDRSDWSLDHVLPRSRGGKDHPDNVVLASKRINNAKSNRTPQEAGLPVPVIRKLSHSLATPSHPDHELFLK